MKTKSASTSHPQIFTIFTMISFESIKLSTLIITEERHSLASVCVCVVLSGVESLLQEFQFSLTLLLVTQTRFEHSRTHSVELVTVSEYPKVRR